jgi:large subunit ribosomal protein L10
MANAEKVAAVAELTERFKDSTGAVLTEYRGLTVAQLAELRRSLGDHATFAVVKNTLTKIAVNEAGLGDELSSLLSGPSAIAFVDGDVVEAAKGLRDFAKANPLLVIKGGVLDGKAMSPSEITKLADLEPREVLLAKLAGAMKASLAGAAATFNALPVQMAQLAEALRRATKADRTTRGSHADHALGIKERGIHHHGEDEHRRPPRGVQGDDSARALRFREAVRGDVRR